MLPSTYWDGVGTPIPLISRLNGPACTYPCQRFAAPSRVANDPGGTLFSLQYTTRVLRSLSSSPHSASREAITCGPQSAGPAARFERGR